MSIRLRYWGRELRSSVSALISPDQSDSQHSSMEFLGTNLHPVSECMYLHNSIFLLFSSIGKVGNFTK